MSLTWAEWWQLVQTPLGVSLILATVVVCSGFWVLLWWRASRRWQTEKMNQQDQLHEVEEQWHESSWRMERALEQLASLNHELQEREQSMEEMRGQRLQSERRAAELDARLDSERRHFNEQMAQMQSAEQRLTDTFKRLAGEIFEDKTRRFSELSQERLGQLLQPIQGQLKDFGKLVQDTHQQEMSRHAVLEKELSQLRQLNTRLSDEAQHLVDALRGDVKTMGSWGEMKLERLLILAGLEPKHEFDMQYSVKNAEGKTLRPDAVIWLPDGKCIIIDAKASLEHYRRYHAASEEQEKALALKRHVQSIRAHIRNLSSKEYHNLPELRSPDFVIMFLPSEPAYIDALQADDALMNDAQRANVILLAPANLLATLRTVASLWHAWRQNENSLDIARRAGLLYDKFVGFTENLTVLGDRLDQAKEAYDQAFDQLSRGRGNLVGQTEKLRQLGARTTKQQQERLREQSSDE